MSTELIINASLPETRIALLENGEIQELQIERASEKGIVGNIYKGKVTRVLPGMQAAFVDIGLEKAAFLYVDDVYVHSEIWEEAEEEPSFPQEAVAETATSSETPVPATAGTGLKTNSPGLSPTNSDTTSIKSPHSEEDFVGDADESEHDDSDPETPLSMGPRADQRRSHGRGSRRNTPHRNTRGRRRTSTTTNVSVIEENTSPQVVQESDRSEMSSVDQPSDNLQVDHSDENRPQEIQSKSSRQQRSYAHELEEYTSTPRRHSQFRQHRTRDRRVRPKISRFIRGQVNIQDLLKEGQEVLVQVSKDPIATKGARLTCHISLPGRHLVCMPTIDHVGVSRRIEREDERRRLRDFVDCNRPKNIGFIVRTASARGQSERRLKQDIDYLTRLWTEIREKAASISAPALVYEDLNAVLKSIRDWVTEDIHKIIVDSRHHYHEILRFVSHFMPSIKQKVELYHGDIPIFDAYNISTELSRALERKVWLKSGGYIVIDQAEALVAIDVNTGRYVGKKNLEDTILKTNLEAVQEIAYQLRLRNCGGIIILDFIDMERDENRYRVYRALEEALQKDRARPTIMKISELGLVEMTRKRTRDTIIRTLCEACSYCEGKGFIKNKMTVAYEVLREIERSGIERDSNKILVQASSDVIDILAIEERETIDFLERRYRKQIYLQAVYDFHPEQFEVITEKHQRKETAKPFSLPAASAEMLSSEALKESPPVTSGLDEARVEPASSSEVVSRVVVSSPALENTASENVSPSTSTVAVSTASSKEDHIEEEDRLVFLRAQAAQDAAIAQQSVANQRTGSVGTFGRQHSRGEGGKSLGSWGGGRSKQRRGAGGGRRGRSGVRYSRPEQRSGRYSYSNQNYKSNQNFGRGYDVLSAKDSGDSNGGAGNQEPSNQSDNQSE